MVGGMGRDFGHLNLGRLGGATPQPPAGFAWVTYSDPSTGQNRITTYTDPSTGDVRPAMASLTQ